MASWARVTPDNPLAADLRDLVRFYPGASCATTSACVVLKAEEGLVRERACSVCAHDRGAGGAGLGELRCVADGAAKREALTLESRDGVVGVVRIFRMAKVRGKRQVAFAHETS